MIRHILTVSTGTLASRTLGFTRDALIAALLGAGPIADAFLVAFQFINVTRRSFTEGALNAALVPHYLRVRETEGAVAAAAFAGRALGAVSLILIVIVMVGRDRITRWQTLPPALVKRFRPARRRRLPVSKLR